MQLKKGEIIEFDVLRMAFGGRGIGKYQEITVFVDKVMPGDKVRAALTRIKPQFLEAELVEIVSPSPERVEPRCSYFGKCGGCQLQFMPYEKQLEIKKQQVIDSFERIGKIYDPPVADPIPCKEEYYYRNKMEFSFGYDENMKFTLGFHIPKRRHDIIDVEECFLQSELSVRIVNMIRDFMKAHEWAPFQYSCGLGFLRSLFIREARHTGEVMVNLMTSDDFPKDFEEILPKFVELLKTEAQISSIYTTQVISKRGQKKQIKERHLFGKKAITEKMILQNGDELEFDILPQAFFQVNTHQAEILYSQVMDFASKDTHEVIFDLFCGTGTIGLFLAKHAKQVYGIEQNEDAVKSANENARRNKIFNIDFYTGDVNKLIKNLRDYPSLIVVDPPRAGLSEKLIAKINDFNSSKIVYVSCNPATLARDCEWFGEYGYKVKEIRPVDMFPQTYHIENVCLLER